MKTRASIKVKVIATLAVLLVLSAVVMVLSTLRVARNASDQVGRGLARTAVQTADRISRTMYERYGDVQAFTLNRLTQDHAHWGNFGENNPLVSTMNDYAQAYGIYSITMLVDRDGKVVALNSRDPAGKPVDTAKLRARTYADAPWFKDAIAGKFFTSQGSPLTGTVIEDVHFSPELREVYGTDGLALGFSAPVRDPKGDVVAVWRNIADFKFVEELLVSAVAMERAAGNTSAEALVLDQGGTVWAEANEQTIRDGAIAHNPEVLGKLNLLEKGYQPVADAVKGPAGFSLHETHRRTGLDQSVGYAFRYPSLGFGGMPWTVLVRMNSDEALASVGSLTRTVYLGLAGSLLVSLLGAYFAMGVVLAPIQTVVTTMNEAAAGDGDMTRRLDESRSDETGDLARSFNTLCGKVRTIIGEVLEAAADVAAASAEISSNTESLAKGVNEQQARATQISAAVDQSSASIGEVARRSAEATEFAEKAGQEAATGGQEVQGSIHSIELVAADVQQAAHAMTELGTKSEQIGAIISVINDIAEQTNLLALNAAIEAARAGEHGRGFAVVADEVRKLAERTQHATGEISQSIKTIQSETNSAVSRMKAGSDLVRGSVEQARKAGETLGRIVTSSKQVAGMVRTIAATAEEQAKATDEISSAVGGIATITNQFSSSTAETSAATHQLSNKSEHLRRTVEKVKI